MATEIAFKITADSGSAKQGISEVTEELKKTLTWSEFVKERMSAYMKELGGHGPAIRKIAEEWKEYKKTGVAAVEGVAAAIGNLPVISGKSFYSIQQEMRGLEAQLLQTKQGTEEYNNVLLRLANTRSQVKLLREQVTLLDPEKKIQAFATAGASIAGGFAAAQGAIALFGGESKLVTATMVKLQAVMALTQGIQAVGQLAKTWKTLNLVMMANPYIAIAAAVVALGAAFVGISKHFGVLKTDAEKTQEAIDKLTAAYERLGTEGEFQLKLLRAQGKETFEAEQKLLLARIKITEEQIKLAEIALKRIGGPYQDLINLFTGADEKMAESLKAAKDNQQKALEDLELLRATQTTKEEDEVKKKDEKDAKKGEEKRQKSLDFLAQLAIDEAAFNQAEKEIEDEEFMARVERETEDLAKEREENAKRFEEDRQERDNAREIELQALLDDEDKRRLIREQGLANERIISQAKMSIATSSIQGLSALGNLFINNEKKAAAFQKGVALADLAVNTGQAITSMLVGVEKTAAAAGPAYPFVKASLYIAGFATILGNMAKAKAIIKGANQGSSPSLESPVLPPPPSAPSLLAPAAQTTAQATAGAISGTGTQTTEEGYFSGFQQPIKAYVVETEITNSQKNIQGILQKSTFP